MDNDTSVSFESVSRKGHIVKIDRISLYIFIILCFTVRMTYVDTLSVGAWVYRIGLVFSVLFIIVSYVQDRKVKIGPALGTMCLFQIVFALSTIINSGISFDGLLTDLYPITFILMYSILVEKYPRQTIKSSAFFFEIVIYINCLAEFIFPHGLYNTSSYASTGKAYFLFGHQNYAGIFIMIALMLGAMRFEMSNDKPRKIADARLVCLFIVSAISVVRVWSVTSVVGLAIFLVVYLFQKLRKNGFPLHAVWAPIINLFIFLVIVLMQNTNLLNWIWTILGRASTLSGRTAIWNSALSSIGNHLLIGVGSAQGAVLEGFSSAHNRYLHTLYIGGIIAFVIFMFFVFYCCWKLQKTRRIGISCGVVACIWAVLTMCQMEIYFTAIFFIPFIIIQQMDVILKQSVSKKALNGCFADDKLPEQQCSGNKRLN